MAAFPLSYMHWARNFYCYETNLKQIKRVVAYFTENKRRPHYKSFLWKRSSSVWENLLSWFQILAVLWMFHSFLWVIRRSLNFMCRLFLKPFLFHLIGVPKPRHGKSRSRGITQNKTKQKKIHQMLLYLKFEQRGVHIYHRNMKDLALLRDYIQSRQLMNLSHTLTLMLHATGCSSNTSSWTPHSL